MFTFSDLKYMYSHPRIRVVQGKAIQSLEVNWENIKTTVRHDYKSPSSKASAKHEFLSMYRNDLEEYMNANPNTMLRVYLPKSVSMILQTLIHQQSDENTTCHVRNDFDYKIVTMVKQKKAFDDVFVSNPTAKNGKVLNPMHRSTLTSLIRDNYGVNNFDEYNQYTILNTAGISKNSDTVELSKTQLKAMKQLCFYKRANYVEIPINTNRAKLLSFINVGEQLWGN